MSDDLIPHMRERIAQCRKILELAHDPRIIDMLRNMIETGEADIARIEAECAAQAEPNPQPMPRPE